MINLKFMKIESRLELLFIITQAVNTFKVGFLIRKLTKSILQTCPLKSDIITI